MQKLSAALLHINCVQDQLQRLLVLAHDDKTCTQVADKVHVEHVVVSIKFFQSSLQQCNPLAQIILKE